MILLIEQKRDSLIVNPGSIQSTIPNQQVVIVSGSINPPGKEPREYAMISKDRLEEYCQRHQYGFIYFTDYYDQEAPAIWQKIYAVREALQEGHQVVVWVDDDIYMTNLEKSIEEFLAMTDKSLIFSEDMDGRFRCNFMNSGFFILRNNQLTQRFIDETLECRTRLYNGYWNEGYFHEQSVMTYLFLTVPEYFQETAVLKKGILQSYLLDNSWRTGDFCIHLAGIKLPQRNQFFREIQQPSNDKDVFLHRQIRSY